jgi:hypothetical protein
MVFGFSADFAGPFAIPQEAVAAGQAVIVL